MLQIRDMSFYGVWRVVTLYLDNVVYDVAVDPVGNAGGPSEPASFTAPIVSLDFLTLSWRQPESPGLSDVLGYLIQWTEAGSVR